MERMPSHEPALPPLAAGFFLFLRVLSWVALVLLAAAAVYAVWLAVSNWEFITV